MTIKPGIRNAAIILVLAALVDGVRGGTTVANVVIQAVSLAFLGAMAWIAVRLYRENRNLIYSLGTRGRTVTYSAIAVIVLVLSATDRLWGTRFGSLVWILALACAGYALYLVYRASKQY